MLDFRGPGAMMSVMEMEKTVIFLLQRKAMELSQWGILYPNLDSVRTEMLSLWSVLAFKTSGISESSQKIQMQLLEYVGKKYF